MRNLDLSGVSETLLLPLYWRARESQRPDALLRDDKAVELVRAMNYDFAKCQKMSNEQVTPLVRVRVIDRVTRSYLERYPGGVVVELGCGLDTRFFRIEDGAAVWYELDLPPVIALRRQLLGEPPRTHLIGCSMLDFGWMEEIPDKRACLFIAEGVFPYFKAREIEQLVLELKKRFPGAELVFDAITPMLIGVHNRELKAAQFPARLRWGLKRGVELESWGEGIRLLDEWFYFDQPEARERGMGWMRYVPILNKSASILHYRLGEL